MSGSCLSGDSRGMTVVTSPANVERSRRRRAVFRLSVTSRRREHRLPLVSGEQAADGVLDHGTDRLMNNLFELLEGELGRRVSKAGGVELGKLFRAHIK